MDRTKKKSVLELAKELPKGKFEKLSQLLEPHEFIENHRIKSRVPERTGVAFKDLPKITAVEVNEKYVTVTLKDGRIVSFPLAWSKLLTKATPRQRQDFTLTAYNIFWNEIDEVIGIENIMYGKKLYLLPTDNA